MSDTVTHLWDDTVLPFQLDASDIRGRVARLDGVLEQVLAQHDYPDRIEALVAEMALLTALIGQAIKVRWKLSLQVRGDGPVHLLVVQVTADGRARGLARWKADSLPAASTDGVELGALFGTEARLVITIEATLKAEPYQGIVMLEGTRLADALARYFRDSEQLQTELVIAVDERVAAGVLLQKLPARERLQDGEGRDADGWRRASMLAATLEPVELRERAVSELLHALYHEERVRLFEESPVRFECSCSRARTDAMLQGLGQAEVEDIVVEQGAVDITCEFCDADYHYDAVDVAALFAGAIEADEDVQH